MCDLPIIKYWKSTWKTYVYVCIHTCLNNNNIIYKLNFGFRQQHSTSHALTNITENIREALDDGNILCEVSADLQEAFHTVNHQVLLEKLNHNEICGVSNYCFKFDLSSRNQYVSINGSGLAEIHCGVPQGSVPGSPSIFILNDLNHVIKFCKNRHFADDNSLLCLSNLFLKNFTQYKKKTKKTWNVNL